MASGMYSLVTMQFWEHSPCRCNLFSFFKKYVLIYFWLPCVFVAALGLSPVSESEAGALSSCEWPSHGGGFSCCGARALGMRASVVMVHQACCSEAVDSFQTRDRTHVLYIGRWILITVPLEKCLTFSNNISTFFNLMRKHTYHNKHKFIALGRRQLN